MLVVIQQTHSKKQQKEQKTLFYRDAKLVNIRIDDEGSYHIVYNKRGTLGTIADLYNCKVKVGNYETSVKLPYVECSGGFNKPRRVLRAWGLNTSDYSGTDVIVYIPEDYKIEVFVD